MALTNKQLSEKRLIALLRKHGKVKIVFTAQGRRGKVDRERILSVNGGCSVRYYFQTYDRDPVTQQLRTTGYKWSRYGKSCFAFDALYHYPEPDYRRIKRKINPTVAIVRAMMQHDRKYIRPLAVYVGKDYKKQII